MICDVVIVCRGHRVSSLSAKAVLKRQQWDNFSWTRLKRWHDAWLVTLQQVLNVEPWTHSPPPKSISSTDYRCCDCLPLQGGRLWWDPQQKRLSRPSWEMEPRTLGCRACGKSAGELLGVRKLHTTSQQAQGWQLIIEILGHDPASCSNKSLQEGASV